MKSEKCRKHVASYRSLFTSQPLNFSAKPAYPTVDFGAFPVGGIPFLP